MNKITPDHLSRSAYVYVRQSTPDQLANNPESRRRQYALATRARALGWENVTVIDDDLGRSGGGTAARHRRALLLRQLGKFRCSPIWGCASDLYLPQLRYTPTP